MSSWQHYNAPNLGLLFYKQLYKEGNILRTLEVKKEKKKQEIVCKLLFKPDDKHSEFKPFYNDLYKKRLSDYQKSKSIYQVDLEKISNKRFTLFTTYPGLLIGSGYAHSTKATGDASIGFYFDHTSGLPVIPGSSVKGVLKSLFENDAEKTDKSSVAAIQFVIDDIVDNKNITNDKEWKRLKKIITDHKTLEIIKNKIFGTHDDDGKDIFLGGFIDFEKTKTQKFLSDDFITPHQPNLLNNPTPIQFLKVLPQIGFEFIFKFTNTEIKDGNTTFNLSTEIKETLFKRILLLLGIGAKTNVGYGQFEDSNYDNYAYPHSSLTKAKTKIEPPKPREKTKAEKKLINNVEIECYVSKIDKKYFYIKFEWDDNLEFRKKLSKVNRLPTENEKIKIRVVSNYFDGKDSLDFQVF